MTIKLSDTAEAASSKTLAALAQVIRALAPEVCSVSFHDFAADTLWLSEDFLLPEDHQLVQDSLSGSAQGSSEFLQPIRSLHEREGLARYEVLLRLRTSEGGLLEPGSFLREAADRHLMPAIDRWVVRTLLVWLSNNRKVWARVPAVFCINLAAQSMTDASFLSYVESCVIKSGLPPQALCFEITERFASSGNISVAESMSRLEALGCEVALDDFGGHAPSYGYLRTVPAHYFKIDSALVGAAPTDRVARAMISAIVRMAGDLGVQTVAESVELDTELQAVRSLGVDYAQGFLLGRPSSLSGYDFEGGARN